jgi:hypothetical protein
MVIVSFYYTQVGITHVFDTCLIECPRFIAVKHVKTLI